LYALLQVLNGMRMHVMRTRALFLAFFTLATPAVAAGPGGSPAAGADVARAQCSACHIVTVERRVPDNGPGAAPPFQKIAVNPALTPDKIRALLRLPHGMMNNVLTTPQDTDNIIAYLQDMKVRTGNPSEGAR